MANENKPLVEVKPGDPITASRWNDMQRALRQEHIQHGHTGTWKEGLFDGPRITSDGLADGAVTAAKLDPRADLKVRSLRLDGEALSSDVLRVTGPTTLDGPLAVAADLAVAGPANLTTLKVSATTELATLKVSAATTLTTLKATATELAALTVIGPTTLTTLKVTGPADLTSLTTSGPLRVAGEAELAALKVTGDLRYGGKLGKLDVSEASTADIRAAELKIGHSARLGKLGRALVDRGDRLVLNEGGDWPLAEVQSALLIKGRHAAVAEGTLPRIVWGRFNSDGTIVAGTGFRGERKNDRTFTWIFFDKPFAGTPVVIGQQYGSGSVLDNLLIDDVSETQFSVMCGDDKGTRSWRYFGFIAIGPG